MMSNNKLNVIRITFNVLNTGTKCFDAFGAGDVHELREIQVFGMRGVGLWENEQLEFGVRGGFSLVLSLGGSQRKNNLK